MSKYVMMNEQILLDIQESSCGEGEPTGRFTRIDGEPYYTIRDYDRLQPFLMSVVSDSDHWLFVSSNGGLTAGRANPGRALFPYDSEDKLHQCHDYTGPRTSLWVVLGKRGEVLWEPFRESSRDRYNVSRNLYKSELGNSLIFEEVNHDLCLTFRYRWCFSGRFGVVREAALANASDGPAEVRLMDGLLNIMPPGISPMIHQQRHCLADAYKHCEVDAETGLGIFSLSSMILDRPEPGESLYATTVWSTGLAEAGVVLDPSQVTAFRRQKRVIREPILKGRKGAYLLLASLTLEPGQTHRWQIVADSHQTQAQVVKTRQRLRNKTDLAEELKADWRAGNENLCRNIASADGLQETGNRTINAHHMANVLFNNMRGGVFDKNYDIGREDLTRFIRMRNSVVAERQSGFLAELAEVVTVQTLIELAGKRDDPDLLRLCYEYLPLYFSRRHGDPSRPWNFFDIRLRDEHGGRVLSYQGNWRDIFQNWEAMCVSFPRFLPSVISKFVNASTADGFNPYRITSEGIDWEILDPDDPLSNIGYWGDHQIVYLLKLLEAMDHYDPGELAGMLEREVFSFADVPYTIKPYREVVEDPCDTITFDTSRAERVAQRVRQVGADGRLLTSGDGSVYHVNLTEKLLVPALSKLSNLVVGGGLWLNTQRPEWNDANNALVGNGLSVVTLCYLRRYLVFLARLLDSLPEGGVPITCEVGDWLDGVYSAFDAQKHVLEQQAVPDSDRMSLLDRLGSAFGDYRKTLYAHGLTGKTLVPRERIGRLIGLALKYVDHSIRSNRREDGMYHAYNLLEISRSRDAAGVSHLYEMLEGQVAVLSSGLLSDSEVQTLLDALPHSALYRPDQDSYLLYPERKLPGFLEKNILPPDRVGGSELLQKLVAAGNKDLVTRDAEGDYRFNSSLYNLKPFDAALEVIGRDPRWADLVERDTPLVRDIYEDVFNHKTFTGRSGGMYGYEGLGCIYWHMVSKLLLAVQECYKNALKQGSDTETIRALADAYYRVRGGLGFNKTPAGYGAFPTDPYSHTPGFTGARQPGMTGQVKEEILTRTGELGVEVVEGCIRFAPTLIRETEFLRIESRFTYYATDGRAEAIDLPEGSIGFTFCQVPVVYAITERDTSVTVTFSHGGTAKVQGDTIPADAARSVFDRTGQVARIDVSIPWDMVRHERSRS
jgi:hypothetical protein